MVINLKRSDLYKKIWRNGINKTASELNTTVQKLKDATSSANIPLPDNSYWGNLHAGNYVAKVKLPNSQKDYIVNIVEKNRQIPRIKEHIPLDTQNNKNNSTIENDIHNYFPDIEFKNPEAINKVINHLKVPKTLPQKKEHFIDDFIKKRKEERTSYFGVNQSQDYINSQNFIGCIYFHKRDNIEISTNALIVTNTLLKALKNANAIVTLGEKNLQLSFENAKLILSCHVPSKQIIVGPDDERWSEWNNKVYIPADENIYFGIKTNSSWKEPRPIHHELNEDDTDYVKKVLLKIISLIPQSRQQLEQKRLNAIEAAKQEKNREIKRQKHEQAYEELNSLLTKVKAHQISIQLASYLEDSNIEDTKTLNRLLNLSKWIDGKAKNDFLTDTDRQNLIDAFFNSKGASNSFYY